MRPPIPALVLILAGSILQSGCNTTESYGYYSETLDADSVALLIEVADRAVNRRDYETYRSLFAPSFMHIDEVAPMEGGFGYGRPGRSTLSRADFLSMVQDVLKMAKTVEVYTRIKEIEFITPGVLAKVTVEEDELVDYQGVEKRSVSLAHYEIGYEDRWIFFKRYTRYATQEIKD